MVHGDSKEAVAYALTIGILQGRGKAGAGPHGPAIHEDTTQDEVLTLFHECLRVVHGAAPGHSP